MTDRMTNAEIVALCQWIEEGASCGLLGDDASLAAAKLQQAHTAIRQLQQQVELAEKARKNAARDAMDRTYMQAAYYSMLGPKGREMADIWHKSGVLRVHHSWGPDAAAMTGEERAEHMLAWNKAAETATPLTGAELGLVDQTMDFDAPLPHAPEPGQ